MLHMCTSRREFVVSRFLGTFGLRSLTHNLLLCLLTLSPHFTLSDRSNIIVCFFGGLRILLNFVSIIRVYLTPFLHFLYLDRTPFSGSVHWLPSAADHGVIMYLNSPCDG